MNMRASFENFHILKLLFPSIFCWYFRYFVGTNDMLVGSFLLLLMVCEAIYKRQYTDKTLTMRKSVYMRASGGSELRKFSYFHILKLIFLSIFCWYFRYFVGTNWHACRLTCTDKFPNVPTKLRKSIIGPCPPPPPPPLATLMHTHTHTHTHTHAHTHTHTHTHTSSDTLICHLWGTPLFSPLVLCSPQGQFIAHAHAHHKLNINCIHIMMWNIQYSYNFQNYLIQCNTIPHLDYR